MSVEKNLNQWQLDQSGPEAYERYLVPLIFAPWAERLIDVVAPGDGARVLDVACGTGIVARSVAPRVGPTGSITGLDVNEGMLAVARASATGTHPSIEWRQGDVTAMPFDDRTFDVLFCQQAMQFFPDRSAALREMHRVLQPGGYLALAIFRPVKYNSAYGPLSEALGQHVGPNAATMMRSPFPDWDGTYIRDLVSGAGFQDVHIEIAIGSERFPSVEELLRQEAASSPLAGPLGEISAETREELLRDLRDRLSDYQDDDGVIFPMESYLVVARR